MFDVIWVLHVLLCGALILLVMLQQGKGADAGAITSANKGEGILGPAGGGNVLTRLTTTLAVIFMVTSILLVRAYLHTPHEVREVGPGKSALEELGLSGAPPAEEAPVEAVGDEMADEMVEVEATAESAEDGTE